MLWNLETADFITTRLYNHPSLSRLEQKEDSLPQRKWFLNIS